MLCHASLTITGTCTAPLFNARAGSSRARVVPERICRARVLHGGEGCEAGMISLRRGSTLPEELITPTADTWPKRVLVSLRWQLYTHFSPQWELPKTMSLLSQVKHLYRYVYDTHIYCPIQGINNLFLFLLFFFSPWIIFTPDQFRSPIHHAAAQTATLVSQKGCHKVRNKWPRAVPAKTDLPAKRSDYKATPLGTPAALAKKCHLKLVLFLVINLS